MELAVRRAILNETGRLCKEKDVRVNEFQNAEQQEAANCRSRRGEVVLPWFYRNLYEGLEKVRRLKYLSHSGMFWESHSHVYLKTHPKNQD